MLVALRSSTRSRYGSILAKEIDCTYSHAIKILQGMEKFGLIIFEKRGRVKSVKLTKRGQEIADHIERITELLKRF